MVTKLKNKILSYPFFRKAKYIIKHVKLPFLGGIELYKIAKFFYDGIVGGFLTSRAAAVAFNFFLAIFPAIIFIFSLIAFIPIEGFQGYLISEILYVAPKIMDTFVEETVSDVIKNKHTSLLSLGFILALYFATNGINSILTAFNMSYHSEEKHTRSFLNQQVTAIVITIFLTVLLLVSTVLTVFGGEIISYVFDSVLNYSEWGIFWVQVARWGIVLGFIYFSVAFIYFYGPKQKVKFFSPGATVATVSMIIFTIGFGFYIENFASYNKLYGSIGTIMGIQLMIYLNSLALLIGYELNAAVDHASTHIKLEEYQ